MRMPRGGSLGKEQDDCIVLDEKLDCELTDYGTGASKDDISLSSSDTDTDGD